MNTVTKSLFAVQAMNALAYTRRSSHIVGYGNPPSEPYYQNGWKLEVLQSESTIPAEVRTRLNILKDSGVKVCHILVAHQEKKEPKRLETPKEVEKVVEVVSEVLPVVADVLVALMTIVGAVFIITAKIFLSIVLYDPVVIVVLEDGTWLEIAKWYD